MKPNELQDPDWLAPGIPSSGQQAFGDRLLSQHRFVVIPSAVSAHSWNLIFASAGAADGYELQGQERFVLDPRLNPAGARA